MSRAVAENNKKRVKDTAAATRSASRRIWEVDAWRGVAISMMIIYHLMWDLVAFTGLQVALQRGFWFYFQRTTATSFVLLVGISLVISYNRDVQRAGTDKGLYPKYLRRGLKILGIAMIITIVIALANAFMPGFRGRIDYGVLHFIGTAIIIAYPFLRFRWLNLFFAALFFATSYAIKTVPVDTLAFVWLGFEPPNYYYLDYFPLVHWFSVVLIGIFIGNTVYAGGVRQFHLPDLSAFFPVNVLRFLGRHSLLIYAIHQPVLLLLLGVWMGIASLL